MRTIVRTDDCIVYHVWRSNRVKASNQRAPSMRDHCPNIGIMFEVEKKKCGKPQPSVRLS